MEKTSFFMKLSLFGVFLATATAWVSVSKSKSGTRSPLHTTSTVTDGTGQNPATLLAPELVSKKVFSDDKRPVVLFDGVCNMCNNAVNLALDWDPNGRLRFAALQSEVGKALLRKSGREADDISSIVLVNQDGAYVKSDAILKITEALSPPFLPAKQVAVLGKFLVPQFIRDIIYDQVADNRYQIMGKRDVCRCDADGEFEDRFVSDDVASL